MKRFIVVCALVAGCSDPFETTISSPGGPATVIDTPVATSRNSLADQIAIGDICASILPVRSTPAAQPAIAELRSRTDFTERELAYIGSGQIATGMSERAGVCALGGNAVTIGSIKTVTTTGHVIKTLRFEGRSNMTLVTDNGIVTSMY